MLIGNRQARESVERAYTREGTLTASGKTSIAILVVFYVLVGLAIWLVPSFERARLGHGPIEKPLPQAGPDANTMIVNNQVVSPWNAAIGLGL